MPTQSNKQTQSVKVVVNNNIKSCCPDKKKRRRKPNPPAEPPADPQMPTPVQPPWARGISSQAVRPMVYTPQTTMIQGSEQIPAYFERMRTNLEASVEDFKQGFKSQFQAAKDLAFAMTNSAEEHQRIEQAVQTAQIAAMKEIGLSTQPSLEEGLQSDITNRFINEQRSAATASALLEKIQERDGIGYAPKPLEAPPSSSTPLPLPLPRDEELALFGLTQTPQREERRPVGRPKKTSNDGTSKRLGDLDSARPIR
jgi:hypothetical protein